MKAEEREWWEKFLKDYAHAEIEYAFEEWLKARSGDEWWPTAARITELCNEYRRGEAQKLLPVGCHRCDWTGWYETTGKTVGAISLTGEDQITPGKEVKPGGVERLVAPCPCQADVSLRTPCVKKRASEEEMRAMWTLVWEMCQEKGKFPGRGKEQVGKLLPTTKELAEQLAAGGRMPPREVPPPIQLTKEQIEARRPAERAEVEHYRKAMEE